MQASALRELRDAGTGPESAALIEQLLDLRRIEEEAAVEAGGAAATERAAAEAADGAEVQPEEAISRADASQLSAFVQAQDRAPVPLIGIQSVIGPGPPPAAPPHGAWCGPVLHAPEAAALESTSGGMFNSLLDIDKAR